MRQAEGSASIIIHNNQFRSFSYLKEEDLLQIALQNYMLRRQEHLKQMRDKLLQDVGQVEILNYLNHVL